MITKKWTFIITAISILLLVVIVPILNSYYVERINFNAIINGYKFSSSLFDIWIISLFCVLSLFYLQNIEDIRIKFYSSLILSIIIVAFGATKSYFNENWSQIYHTLLLFLIITIGIVPHLFGIFCYISFKNENTPHMLYENLLQEDTGKVQEDESKVSIYIDGQFGVQNHTGRFNDDNLAKIHDSANQKGAFARIAKWAESEIPILMIATIALVISTTSGLMQPLLFGEIINVSTTTKDLNILNKYSLLLAISFLVGGASSFIRGWLYTLVGEKIVCKLRNQLFQQIAYQDISFFDTNKTGELMNRLSSDTTVVVQAFFGVNVSMGLRSAGQVIVSLILLFITSWKLTLMMMAVLPFILITIIIYGGSIQKISKDYQDALARAADLGNESISNARIVRSFGGEALQSSRYEKDIGFAFKKGAKKALAYGIFVGGITTVGGLSIGSVLYYGARLVISGELSPGELTTFMLYTVYITVGLGTLSSLYTDFMSGIGASKRILQLMDKSPDINLQGGGIWLSKPIVSGHVTYKDVTFRYPTRADVTVLKNVSFEVLPKQTVAFVGQSGSGKSTLLSLLQRYYDVSSGSICIDHLDIRTLDPHWLHNIVAIVPQEPVLFSDSIRSNIGYSRLAYLAKKDRMRDTNFPNLEEPTLQEIIEAAKLANAHDFIMQFPEGYDTLVGERGVRLSGGQKQRVAIARAILADPVILLLDEATSALDSESELLVQQAIDRLMKNRTVLVVAHRLSTVRDADVIMVCAHHGIVSSGTHEELLRTCPIYTNLVQRQLLGPLEVVSSSSSGDEEEDMDRKSAE